MAERQSPAVVEWAYHATTLDALAGILRGGLRPRCQLRRHADEERCVPSAVIFFSPTADLARTWGPVVLRFPFPDQALVDDYSDTLLLEDGRILESGWYSRRRIPPEAIEVRGSQGWHPLSRGLVISMQALDREPAGLG
jgi:hypothetical protein